MLAVCREDGRMVHARSFAIWHERVVHPRKRERHPARRGGAATRAGEAAQEEGMCWYQSGARMRQ
jgi:hypothetical protein